jgi:hypothetical protein
LDKGDFPLSQVGIQFLQIGSDSDVSLYLEAEEEEDNTDDRLEKLYRRWMITWLRLTEFGIWLIPSIIVGR